MKKVPVNKSYFERVREEVAYNTGAAPFIKNYIKKYGKKDKVKMKKVLIGILKNKGYNRISSEIIYGCTFGYTAESMRKIIGIPKEKEWIYYLVEVLEEMAKGKNITSEEVHSVCQKSVRELSSKLKGLEDLCKVCVNIRVKEMNR